MSKKTQNKFTVRADGFEGIRSSPPTAGHLSASDIVNFRILKDGSLKKRCGFYPLFASEVSLRAFIKTEIGQTHVLFLLYGDGVFLLDLETESVTPCGKIDTQNGKAHFFYHRGILFLLADAQLYAVRADGVEKVTGYVPLIGKDWPDGTVGSPAEAMNLLHNQARISYVLSDPPSIFLCAPYPIQSVDAVIRNGVTLSAEEYEVDRNFNTVNLRNPVAGDRVTVCFTFEDRKNERQKSLLTCHRSASFGSADTNRLCFWGECEPTVLFCSSHVSAADAEASAAVQPKSRPLYIPEGSEFTVGDGRFPIRGAIPCRDCLLLFTEGATFAADLSSSGSASFPTRGINASVGCFSPLGVTLADGEAISVGSDGIYRWKATSDGSFAPLRISDDIQRLLAHDFFRRAELCYEPTEHELWICDSKNACVWICRPEIGHWFRFEGIEADCLLNLNGRMGFVKNGNLFAFDAEYGQDVRSDGSAVPIKARYTAVFGDLESAETQTLSHIVFCGDADRDPLDAVIGGGNLKKSVSFPLNRPVKGGYEIRRIRCPTGRFRCAELSFRSDTSARPLIHAIRLIGK